MRKIIITELDRSKEVFITRHIEKYGYQHGLPPAWKAFEVASLGSLSHMYSNIHYKHKRSMSLIAQAISANNINEAKNWLHAFTLVRNLCAHHARIYGRKLDIALALPNIVGKAVERLGWVHQVPAPNTPYAALCVLAFSMKKISPGNRFTERLLAIVEAYPDLKYENLGFKDGWQSEPLWRINTK